MDFYLQHGLDEQLFKLLNKLYRPFLSTRHLKDRFQFTVFCDEAPFPVGIVSVNKGSDTFMQIALIPEMRGFGAGRTVIKLMIEETKLAKYGWTCEKNNYPSLKMLTSLGGGIFESSVRQKSKKTYEGFFYAEKETSRKMHGLALDSLNDAKTEYAKWVQTEYSLRTRDLVELRQYLLGYVNIVDIHSHSVTPSALRSGMLPSEIVKRMPYDSCQNKIWRRIVFGVPDSNCDLAEINEEVLAQCRSENSLIPVAILHDGINLAEMFNRGVFLFKEHVYGQRLLRNRKGEIGLASPSRIKLYRELAQHGAVLITHMGPNLVSRIVDVLGKVPKLSIIVAHLGSPMDHVKTWDSVLVDWKELKQYRNVLFDVSAVEDPLIVEHAIEVLSCERLVWGSDYPWESPQLSIRRLVEDDRISILDLNKILSSNATNILNRIDKSHA